MLFINSELQIFTMPKAASTSIKLWQAKRLKLWCARENTSYPNSDLQKDVHQIFPNLPFEVASEVYANRGEFIKVAVIRDPIRRLLSSYGNRVIHHQDLKKVAPQKLLGRLKFQIDHWGFKTHPKPDDFFSNLDLYQRASPGILHHTRSCKYFLGLDLDYFDHVFMIEEMEKFEIFLSEKINMPVKFPREQTRGPKITLDDLSVETKKIIVGRVEEDYEFLKDFYEFPSV